MDSQRRSAAAARTTARSGRPSATADDDLVVLEGHARLTALLLCPDRLPPELEVLVGASPAMTRWGVW